MATQRIEALDGFRAVAVLGVSLNGKSVLRSFLETKFMNRIGKYSYSMYLWHWIVAYTVVYYGKGIATIPFIISLLILFPVSLISYVLFERFYFQKKFITTTIINS